MRGPDGSSVVIEPGMYFRIMTVLTLTNLVQFIMWLGEQITERGIGNGISLIIFAGIACNIPSGFMNTVKLLKAGQISAFAAILTPCCNAPCDSVHNLHGKITKKDPCAVCKKGSSEETLRRTVVTPPVEVELGWCYTSYIRIVDNLVPCHDSAVHRPSYLPRIEKYNDEQVTRL